MGISVWPSWWQLTQDASVTAPIWCDIVTGSYHAKLFCITILCPSSKEINIYLYISTVLFLPSTGKSLLRCHIIENCSFVETLFLLLVSVSTVRYVASSPTWSWTILFWHWYCDKLSLPPDQPADLRAGQHPHPAGGGRGRLAQDPEARAAVRRLRGVHHLVLQRHAQPRAHLPQRRHLLGAGRAPALLPAGSGSRVSHWTL